MATRGNVKEEKQGQFTVEKATLHPRTMIYNKPNKCFTDGHIVINLAYHHHKEITLCSLIVCIVK